MEAGNVVEVTTRGDTIQGSFREPVKNPQDPQDTEAHKDFTTHLPIDGSSVLRY